MPPRFSGSLRNATYRRLQRTRLKAVVIDREKERLNGFAAVEAQRTARISHRSGGVFLSQDQYKLKVVRLESGELEIQANRAGLKDLAEVCQGLSELTDEQAKTPANHYHIADYMNNAEDGSLELIIRYDPNL